MNELDEKILDNFPGKVVRKDLTNLMKKGANVPTYVLEYLLGMYCATDDEDAIEVGLGKIKRILSENYVRPDQSEYVKSKIKENGQYTIIDKITVELDEREDKYVAWFTNLNMDPFEVSSDLVVHNEKLLVGGIWCIVKIEYVEVARIMSRILFESGVLAEAKLVETDARGLIGKFVGETAPKTEAKIKDANLIWISLNARLLHRKVCYLLS